MYMIRSRLPSVAARYSTHHNVALRPSFRLFSSVTANDVVFEVTQAEFNDKVMKSPVPIVLDCYANWCGPCKQLDPLLQKAVIAQDGKVKLAKLDTDKNAELAGALGIKSLPTVYGIANSKMVDSFIGMQSEQQIAEFVAKVAMAGTGLPANPAKAALTDLTNLLGSEKAGVQEVKPFYEQLLQFEPFAPDHELTKDDKQDVAMMRAYSVVGLAKCALEAGDITEAKTQVETLESQHKKLLNDPLVKQVISQVKIQESAQGLGELADVANAAAANPDSCEAVYALAAAQFAKHQNAEAVASALKALKLDPTYNDGAPKKLLLDIFEALGPNDPLTKSGRRKMSALIL